MPAERTAGRGLKRSDSTGNHQLVWQAQNDSTGVCELSFAPAMTPITFSDEPPPLVDAPTEFILFPPPDEAIAPRRQAHSKKKPENHIPRPPNAFILFRSSFIKSQHVSTEVETNHSTLSKIIGITWQSLPEDERKVWHQKAKEALDEHKRKFPKYAFRPVQTKAKGAPSEKRKVREVEPKDIKRCAKIAQLLVQGKKGHELDAAIQEFDKHHVPEVVTRFEAPITARSYRRSSSAPIPDTENAREGQSFLQKVSTLNKPRASSTRPTRCSTPASQPEAIVQPTALPLKQESPFQNFASFSFDDIASPTPPYECDPLSPIMASVDSLSYPSPGLTIDTDFMGLQDWTASPSPMTPQTPPNYTMSPAPMAAIPSFAAGFDAFDQVHHQQKSFDDFANAFPISPFDQTCMPQQQTLCGGGGVSEQDMMFTSHYQAPIGHLEMDFSSFIGGMPQYAM